MTVNHHLKLFVLIISVLVICCGLFMNTDQW